MFWLKRKIFFLNQPISVHHLCITTDLLQEKIEVYGFSLRKKKSPASFLKPGTFVHCQSQAVLVLRVLTLPQCVNFLLCKKTLKLALWDFIIPIPEPVASCACLRVLTLPQCVNFLLHKKTLKLAICFLYQSLGQSQAFACLRVLTLPQCVNFLFHKKALKLALYLLH